MRHVVSILLAMFLGLGPLATAFQGDDDVRLPACCRRNGAHHCDMSDAELGRVVQAASGSTPVLAAPAHCPLYPGAALASPSTVHALAASLARISGRASQDPLIAESLLFSHSAIPGAHAVRGPPSVSLS